jgi:hypothetical protein
MRQGFVFVYLLKMRRCEIDAKPSIYIYMYVSTGLPSKNVEVCGWNFASNLLKSLLQLFERPGQLACLKFSWFTEVQK